MLRLQNIKQIRLNSFWIVIGILCFSSVGIAAQPTSESAGEEACGMILDSAGTIQILNASRTELVYGEKKSAVPCGGWVSLAAKSWVKIQHREGYVVHLSQGSFAQFLEGHTPLKESAALEYIAGDRLILYRGQAYFVTRNGMPPFYAMTANARARVSEGAVILVYDAEAEKSQLVTLEGQATFENRFQAARKIQVSAGEASDLSLKEIRLIPSIAHGITVASLKSKLEALQVGSSEAEGAVRHAVKRMDRKFASLESVQMESLESKGESTDPLSAQVEDPEAKKLHAHFIKKVTGDPEDWSKVKVMKEEKKKLMKELTGLLKERAQ